MGLGGLASGIGFFSVVYIVWIFGTAEFAIFVISLAKISLILLVLEIVPSQYSIFKMQNDPEFSSSVATFYLGVAPLCALMAGLLAAQGIVDAHSWLIIPYAFLGVTERYIELKTQSSGIVGAFGRMPAVSNLARIIALAILGLPIAGQHPADAIWGSLCIGTALGQIYVLLRFPKLRQDLAQAGPVESVRRLLAAKSQYPPYIVNSVLKRLKDTFLPLFCDLVIPAKAEIGRLLIFTRANEAVCGQVRVIEAFMVNSAVRENFRHARRRIFWTIAPAGHAAVVMIALLLMYRHGFSASDALLALLTGVFVYPYVLELFWRNDALASFRPRQVTISLLAFLAGMTIPPLVAVALGALSFPIIIGSYVLGQILAAATYWLFPQERRHSRHGSQPA